MARPTKITGMDVTPFSGVKIQKVGAIYTRTLEEGGAIYLENGVMGFNGDYRGSINQKKRDVSGYTLTGKRANITNWKDPPCFSWENSRTFNGHFQ